MDVPMKRKGSLRKKRKQRKQRGKEKKKGKDGKKTSRFPPCFPSEVKDLLLATEARIPNCKVFVLPNTPQPPLTAEVKLLGKGELLCGSLPLAKHTLSRQDSTETIWCTWFPHLFGSQLMPPVSLHFFGCGNVVILEPRKGVTEKQIEECGTTIYEETKHHWQRVGRQHMQRFLRLWNRYIIPGPSMGDVFLRWLTPLALRFGNEIPTKLLEYLAVAHKLPDYYTHLIFMKEKKVVDVVQILDKYNWQEWTTRAGLFWHMVMPCLDVTRGFDEALTRLEALRPYLEVKCTDEKCTHKDPEECLLFQEKVTKWYEAVDRYTLTYSDVKELPKFILNRDLLASTPEDDVSNDDEDADNLFLPMEWKDLTEVSSQYETLKEGVPSVAQQLFPSCLEVVQDLEQFFSSFFAK